MNAGTLQRARKTPSTMMKETVIGEMSGLTSLMGASAPPSQAPAANPQKMPRACRLRRRVACIGLATASAASASAVVRIMSAEVIQAQQACDEGPEPHPGVDGGGDYTKKVAGDVADDCEF